MCDCAYRLGAATWRTIITATGRARDKRDGHDHARAKGREGKDKEWRGGRGAGFAPAGAGPRKRPKVHLPQGNVRAEQPRTGRDSALARRR